MDVLALVISLVVVGIALRAQNEAKDAKQEVRLLRHELAHLAHLNKNKKEK